MPYLIISTRIRLESGPTTVGDAQADPEVMVYLEATLIRDKCNNFSEYRTENPASMVLEKLEHIGYRVVSMAGIGQTCAWLLHKP